MTDLETLTPDECWRLLGKRVVGRVGFDLGRGPRIHPVNYRVDGRSVVLRTTEDAELTRFVEMFAAGSLVAFEVDEIDYEWHHGWSVLIEGRIERVEEAEQLHRLHAAWPRPWVDGARNVVARVTPREITGRRLGPDATL
jgi:nitroimidazol reductase NimA-like FMN-containing flavoprotein (pyridoxamine 5'-phosphate oxidase superfamily)